VAQVVFYGTSGWFENENGCTSCVGVHLNDTDVVLFDLGTGVRRVPKELIQGKRLTVVLSHLHLDHCYGLHVLPRLQPSCLKIIVHEDLRGSLETLFGAPFTKPYQKLGFPVEIVSVRGGRTEHDGFTLDTRELKHNTPVIGARLTTRQISLTYCVDTTICEGILDLSRDPDLLILETAPPPGRSTNGYHLDLTQLRQVLAQSKASSVIITHFGATKFPDDNAKQGVFRLLSGYHPDLSMAYDGLSLEV